jgi:hypothetical protein
VLWEEGANLRKIASGRQVKWHAAILIGHINQGIWQFRQESNHFNAAFDADIWRKMDLLKSTSTT